jgi:uncharacterized Tic20 family protein
MYAQGQTTTPQPLSIPLRTGEAMTLLPDGLVIGVQRHSLDDLTAATMVADPFLPPVPGATVPPAISLRMRDGAVIIIGPSQPYDTWRMLEAIYIRRPDLRTPLPPPPPVSQSFGVSTTQWASRPDNQNLLAGLSHLSIFLLPFIFPLIIWLALKDSAPYASRQAKQAFWWHVMYAVTGLVIFVAIQLLFVLGFAASIFGFAASASSSDPQAGLPLVGFIGSFLISVLAFVFFFAVAIYFVVFGILGAVRAFKGEEFHYPFLGRLS